VPPSCVFPPGGGCAANYGQAVAPGLTHPYADGCIQVSENRNLRILECGRLQDFEASGCILLRIAHGGRYQAVCQACCKSRLQWSIHATNLAQPSNKGY